MQQALVTLHGAVTGLGLIVNQTKTKGDKAAATDTLYLAISLLAMLIDIRT